MPESATNETLLAQAKERMSIYDADHQLIGEVLEVFLGAVATPIATVIAVPVGGAIFQSPEPAIGTVGGTDQAGNFENKLPEKVRASLLHQGYVKAKGGAVFGPIWYITPNQIASIQGQTIYLRVPASKVVRSR